MYKSVSSAILASFYIPVSFHYKNNALCKSHKVSNLASLMLSNANLLPMFPQESWVLE